MLDSKNTIFKCHIFLIECLKKIKYKNIEFQKSYFQIQHFFNWNSTFCSRKIQHFLLGLVGTA